MLSYFQNNNTTQCPGCGHGGCLEHALEWFNDPNNEFREYCPTGCGHRLVVFLHFDGITTG